MNEPFDLIELLGTGGFAQTWRARVIDPELLREWGEEEVAIKIPLSKQKERVLRKELELNASLSLQLTGIESQYLVKYYGFEVFKNQLVMVMKYVKGGSMRGMMGSIGYWKRMDIKKALPLAEKILEGLAVIHEKHIVHRDIKPENILIQDDTPKITDLGIGRMLRADEMASTTVGTLFYMSPEMLYRESGASFNTDIWSFGVTFYEMLCGQFPFGITEKTPPGKVMDLIMDKCVLVQFPPDVNVPARIQKVLKKALSKEPESRYQSAREMLEDLRGGSMDDNDVELTKEIDHVKEIMQDPMKATQAECALNELLKKYPDSSRVYVLSGEYYNKCGNHDKAIDMFKKGIEKDNRNSLLHWGIAIAFQKKGDARSAAASLHKALELGLEKGLERYAKLLLKTLESKE